MKGWYREGHQARQVGDEVMEAELSALEDAARYMCSGVVGSSRSRVEQEQGEGQEGWIRKAEWKGGVGLDEQTLRKAIIRHWENIQRQGGEVEEREQVHGGGVRFAET